MRPSRLSAASTEWSRRPILGAGSALIRFAARADINSTPQATLALSSSDLAVALERLTNALTDAHAARRGVPIELRPVVADYAKASRSAGVQIGALLVDVKQLVRRTTGQDEALFIPKVIGWAIAGYFEGTSSREQS
jgi:hypothetical protein